MKIQIKNKIPKVIGSADIVRNNNNYEITVETDAEWDNLTLTAVMVTDSGDEYTPVILSNGKFTSM